MTVQVDAVNVPIPWDQVSGRSRRSKYPFGQLQPGGSFVVTGEKTEQNRAVAALRMWRRKNRGVEIVWHRQFDQVRFWRVDAAARPDPLGAAK